MLNYGSIRREVDSSAFEADVAKGETKYYVGVRCKILDSVMWLSPVIKFIETCPIIRVPILFLYQHILNHPGLRHVEYFHYRVVDSRMHDGHITSWEAENAMSLLSCIIDLTLVPKIVGYYPAKLVIAHIKLADAKQSWFRLNSVGVPGTAGWITYEVAQQGVCLETARNDSYDYWCRLADYGDYEDILHSFREPLPEMNDDALHPGIYVDEYKRYSLCFSFNMFGYSFGNCGHQVKRLIDMPDFWNPSQYRSFSNTSQALLQQPPPAPGNIGGEYVFKISRCLILRVLIATLLTVFYVTRYC